MSLDNLPASIVPLFGSAAVGPYRFPRPEIEIAAIDAMTRTNGLRLFGLRRIGKSTLLEYCAEVLGQKGIHVINVDAEGMSSELDLLYDILAKLPSKDLQTRILMRRQE